jgi:redox-sensitive bicupin YhaK (pirin superfamily)
MKKIKGHSKDLGGFVVERFLPSVEQRAIGPFVFLDRMGPSTIPAGSGIDVRPHPHIGLSTLTYLFKGAIFHRDSLGNALEITPGAVNWMTAGRGIVHSERTAEHRRTSAQEMLALQFWVGLPEDKEECAPSFTHAPADTIPVVDHEHVNFRVVVGELFGKHSPVLTEGPLLFLDLEFQADTTLNLGKILSQKSLWSEGWQWGVYPIHQAEQLRLDSEHLSTSFMYTSESTDGLQISGSTGCRCVLIAGPAFSTPRFMWWNFVSSRKERIEQAKQDWSAQRMGVVPGETEFIPLP